MYHAAGIASGDVIAVWRANFHCYQSERFSKVFVYFASIRLTWLRQYMGFFDSCEALKECRAFWHELLGNSRSDTYISCTYSLQAWYTRLLCLTVIHGKWYLNICKWTTIWLSQWVQSCFLLPELLTLPTNGRKVEHHRRNSTKGLFQDFSIPSLALSPTTSVSLPVSLLVSLSPPVFLLDSLSLCLSLCIPLSIQFNSIQGLYWHGKHVLTLPKQVR